VRAGGTCVGFHAVARPSQQQAPDRRHTGKGRQGCPVPVCPVSRRTATPSTSEPTGMAADQGPARHGPAPGLQGLRRRIRRLHPHRTPLHPAPGRWASSGTGSLPSAPTLMSCSTSPTAAQEFVTRDYRRLERRHVLPASSGRGPGLAGRRPVPVVPGGGGVRRYVCGVHPRHQLRPPDTTRMAPPRTALAIRRGPPRLTR
jgi:hypothetical protein